MSGRTASLLLTESKPPMKKLTLDLDALRVEAFERGLVGFSS
jgi:hypothetical protein